MVKSSCLDINAREFVPKNLILDDDAAASGDDVASTHSSNSLSASAKGRIFDENLIKIAPFNDKTCDFLFSLLANGTLFKWAS